MIEPITAVFVSLALGSAILVLGVYTSSLRRRVDTLETLLKYTRDNLDKKGELVWELKRDHVKLVDALGYEMQYPSPSKYVKKHEITSNNPIDPKSQRL